MTINVTPIPRLVDLAAPAFTLGTSNAAGSATTAVSSNSTLLAFDATVPTTIAYSASAAAGSAVVAAKRDHTHGMAAQTVLKTTVVSADRSAAAGSGDQAITGAGFAPKAVIYLGTPTVTRIASWGFGDDAAADRDMYRDDVSTFSYATELVRLSNAAGSASMVGALKSMDADGCTITWTKTGAGQYVASTILFLG